MTETTAPRPATAPGHPVKEGAGYDCQCGECLVLRAAAPACRTCNDSGVVTSADPADGSPYESACPEPVHDDARDIGAQRAADLLAKGSDGDWLGI